ncbi:oligoribonuclease [Candidatus Babeliales bacterium]|nr:oligoribonuclease [Candidatus Babeliales bacterium]
MKHKNNMIWIDCEMTGLDFENDTILEIASVVTDAELNVVAEGPALVIHKPKTVIEAMGEWCQKQHKRSELIYDVHQSQTTLEQAEEQTLAFLEEYCFPRISPLCGNSVWSDRMFLRREMPKVDAFTNYRIVDVSSIKELVKRWYQIEPETAFVKKELHRAQPDIYESINELKFYRDTFFIPAGML